MMKTYILLDHKYHVAYDEISHADINLYLADVGSSIHLPSTDDPAGIHDQIEVVFLGECRKAEYKLHRADYASMCTFVSYDERFDDVEQIEEPYEGEDIDLVYVGDSGHAELGTNEDEEGAA